MRLHVPVRQSRAANNIRLRVMLAFLLVLTLGLSTGWSPTSVGATGFVVNTDDDTIDAGGGQCVEITTGNIPGPDTFLSLREAICAANNNPGPDTITFNLPANSIIGLSFGELTITDDLTITGLGETSLTIDGNYKNRIFNVQSGMVAISDLTITAGSANPGGCIYNQATLTLTDVTVDSCEAHARGGDGYGGGIYNSNTLNVVRATISDNNADYGGGIANFGTLIVDDSEISDQGNVEVAPIFGGGLFNFGSATLSNTLVAGNLAEGGGGIFSGVYMPSNCPVLIEGVVDRSVAASAACAIAADRLASVPNVTLALTQVTISGNIAYDGGGLFVGIPTDFPGQTSTTIDESTISDNDACTGGGITNFSNTLAITNSTISGNRAGFDESLSCEMEENYIFGGGIDSIGYFTLTNSTVSSNSSTAEGGGIMLESSTASIAYSTITGNSAANDSLGGGGIYSGPGCGCPFEAAPTQITSAEVASHRKRGGIPIRPAGAVPTLNSTIVAGNTGPANLQDCGSDTYAISSGGHNLVGTGTGCPSDGTGDLTTANIATVLNATLGDNGGLTETHALIAGSPALGAGDPVTCTTTAASRDQRGEPRPSGIGCDIGAYELTILPSPSASASASPSVTPLVTLTVQTTGTGTVEVAPAPVSSGGTPTNKTYQYAPGTVVTLTAKPGTGQIFARWTIDGTGELPYGRGWASPLTITLGEAHTAKADFAARPTFTDVPSNHPDIEPIVELAARGIAKGYTQGKCAQLTPPVNAPCYGPASLTLRVESALFLTRLLNLTDENHGNGGFSDVAGLTAEARQAIGTMAHYNVFQGYGNGTFGPNNNITYAETILVISRAMVAKGYWTKATVDDPTIYPNLYPGQDAHLDIVTFVKNAGAIPGFANNTPQAPLNVPAPRDWTAVVLWQALNNYFSVDEPGKGGYVP